MDEANEILDGGAGVQKTPPNCFRDEMAGVCHVGRLDKTLADHARALRVMIEKESGQPFPNNHLISVLRDAACLGYEHVEMARIASVEPTK